jgi:hypothetical protein
MRHFTGLVCAFALVGVCRIASADDSKNNDVKDVLEKVEHRTNDGGAKAHGSGGGNPIAYHGGPVILNGVHAYYIWYGGWTQSGSAGYDPYAANILNTLAQHIGGSPYFNINTTYYSGAATKTYITNSVALTGSCRDNYSQGTNLTDRAVANVVANAIAHCFAGTPDPNGVYFVLASKDVKETSGFCSQYCGWHTYGTMNGVYVKYAFIGDAAQCLSACSMFGSTGWKAPNGDPGADGMASIIAHELEESTTDPLLNAWYDSSGAENADKCAWTFGTVTQTPTATYNVNLGLNYLIQQNWVYNPTTSLQGCAMAH